MNRRRLWLAALLLGLAQAAPAHDVGVEGLRRTGKAFSAVAKKVAPAVALVQVEERSGDDGGADGWPFHDDLFRRFFGEDLPGFGRPPARSQRRSIGQGSGFAFAQSGDSTFLLTANHVVDNARRIRVRFQDGRQFTARLRAADPKSDVAVLEIPARGLPLLGWGDSAKLEVGEWVVAMGNPFGLSHTLTTGVVSAKGRSSLGISDYEDFIQTDAAINPGNSGGPLLNLDGEVVGMNTAIFSKSGGYMGVGFAIPSNLARVIAEQLVASGRVLRGYIGLTVQPITPEIAEALRLGDPGGVLVNQVNPDSPAARAGLRAGDVLVSFDGTPLTDGGHYRNRAALSRPGSTALVGIVRDGRRIDIPVKVGRLDEEAGARAEATEAIGLSVRALTAEETRRLGALRGVVVTQVTPGSLAALAGIRPGTLIVEANRQPVTTPADFAAALGASDGSLLLRLADNGGSRYLTLRWH